MYLTSIFLILLNIKLTFSWPTECEDSNDCCSYEVLHENGVSRKQKPDCRQFDIPRSDSGKAISVKQAGNLEYYLFKGSSSTQVLRLKWKEFKLSDSMTNCVKDKAYVHVG